MSISSNPSEAMYDVVVNAEGQHSLWPTPKPLPDGWLKVGTHGTKAACLAFINEAWTDMRPQSLVTDTGR